MNLDVAVLRALRGAAYHLPLSELAAQVHTTPADLLPILYGWQAAGFEIEIHPGLGCRLRACPDRLIADDLQSRLEAPNSLAREIQVFAETNSTNDVASKLGRQGHPGGVVVFAERQTAGRGRFGRRWDSADHAGLWFSILLRPEWPFVRWPRLTTWAGVSVAVAVERCLRQPARLKWPNDVLVSGRKVAGILIESATDAQGQPFAVAGIGVNVNQTEFPEEIAARAGSLAQLSGAPVDRPALAAALLAELAAQLPLAGTGSQLIDEAARRSAVLGQWIRLQAGQSVIEGEAEALDDEGNLLVRLSDGTLHRATAGEVTSQLR